MAIKSSDIRDLIRLFREKNNVSLAFAKNAISGFDDTQKLEALEHLRMEEAAQKLVKKPAPKPLQKTTERRVHSVHLPGPLYDQVKDLAARNFSTISHEIRQALIDRLAADKARNNDFMML